MESGNENNCPICHQYYKKPKILPCGHLVCQSCLVERLYSHPDATCPSCGFQIESFSTGAQAFATSLPTDLSTEARIESLKMISKPQKCVAHEDTGATSVCLDCRDLLCDECASSHTKFRVSRNHRVKSLHNLTPEHLAASLPAICSTHDKQCDFFCCEHQVAICTNCAFYTHKPPECQEPQYLEKIERDTRDSLEELFGKAREQETKFKQAIDEVSLGLKQMEETAAVKSKEIEVMFHRLEQFIRTCQKRLEDEIQEKLSEAKKPLLQRKRVLEVGHEKWMNHRRLVKQSTESTPVGHVWHVYKIFQKRIEELANSVSTGEKIVPEFTFDMKEKILNKICCVLDSLEALQTVPAVIDSRTSLMDKKRNLTSSEKVELDSIRRLLQLRMGQVKDQTTAPQLDEDLKRLQQCFHKLRPYNADEYKEIVTFRRARPIFSDTVLRLRNSHPLRSSDRLQNELSRHCMTVKQDREQDLTRFVEDWALQWRRGKQLSEDSPTFKWMSDTLSVDLNLAMDSYPPACVTDQLLVLGEDLPPLILAVYDTAQIPLKSPAGEAMEMQSVREDVVDQIQDFTVKIARLLTSSLVNFCACDFVLLPCKVEAVQGSLLAVLLEVEVKAQNQFACQFHTRRETLDEPSVLELKEALTATVSCSRVPFLLRDTDIKKDHLLLLDYEWCNALLRTIDVLVNSVGGGKLYYKSENEFKVKVAIIEAARRLSFREEVAVITEGRQQTWDLKTCVQYLVDQSDEDDDVKLRLSCDVSSTTSLIIFIDMDPQIPSSVTFKQNPRVFSLLRDKDTSILTCL